MDLQSPTIQWFPGHMTKTKRLIEKKLGLVDLVVELTDARVPQSSRNPEFEKLIARKPRIILLNKADMADEVATKQWLAHFQRQGICAIACDCKSGKGVASLPARVRAELAPLLAKRRQKGMVGGTLRLMVLGIPNVGKSSLINRLAKAKRAKVEDRPGVTRGGQWVSIGKELELLDMPGVLWPKFDDAEVGRKLAFIGSVKDDVMDLTLLALQLIMTLRKYYPTALAKRYGIEPDEVLALSEQQLLQKIAKKRAMLLRGGDLDIERAGIMLLDEFRGGQLGRITLDVPKGSL